MIDKIIDALKELLNGDKPFSRKLRILRYGVNGNDTFSPHSPKVVTEDWLLVKS